MQAFIDTPSLPQQPLITCIIQGWALWSFAHLSWHVDHVVIRLVLLRHPCWRDFMSVENVFSPWAILLVLSLSFYGLPVTQMLVPALLSFFSASIYFLSIISLFLLWINILFLACSFHLPNRYLALQQHPFCFSVSHCILTTGVSVWFFSRSLAYSFLFKMYLSGWLKVHNPSLPMCLLWCNLWYRLFSWWDNCPSNVLLLYFVCLFPPHVSLVTQATHDGGRCQTHSELGVQWVNLRVESPDAGNFHSIHSYSME